jgi:hypothetical protein
MSTTKAAIIYGPPACGKTRNAAALMRFLGCATIVDDWRTRNRAQPLVRGALHLTQNCPLDVDDRVVVRSFAEVMSEMEVATRPRLPEGEFEELGG